MKNKNVHTEHCCVEHGCKYLDNDCPVYLGYQKQSFPCEECGNDFPVIPEVSNETIAKRREEYSQKYDIDDFD